MQKITCLLYAIIILLFFNLTFTSCKEDPPVVPPPPPEPKAVLTVESVTCTETWLKLVLENFELAVNVSLAKDSIPVLQIINLTSNDTVIYIDSLLPNQTYKFQSVIQSFNQTSEVKSNELSVTTLDTTSHNFSYEIFEFGEPLTGNGSILYDVAIVGEEIWAVGEIYLNDSLGNTLRYNAVHWNGNEWNLKRINMESSCNPVTYPPLRAIWAFSADNIVVTSGGSIGWFDGITNTPDCSIRPLLTGSINKIWGTSNSDLYVVGNEGNIAHYNGSQWKRVESGTDLALTDIYANNENEVYISGAYTPEVKGILLKGNSNGFSVMINSGIINQNELFETLYGELAAVWIDETGTIYTGGNLLFRYKNNSWNYETSLPENFIGGNPGAFYRGFISSIRGNSSNDYIIAGDRSTLKHFNGFTWEQLGLPYSPSSPIIWYSVEQKGNTAVTVGDIGSKALIMVLKR